MPYQIARFGWVRDLPDQRTTCYAAPPQYQCAAAPGRPAAAVPARLRPGPDRQLHRQRHRRRARVRADEAEAGAAADFMPSRLFIYYNERAIEHTVGSDTGAQIRDGMKSVAKLGVCREDRRGRTTPTTFPPNDQPPRSRRRRYTDASKHQAIHVQRVPQDLGQMKGCLAAGYPFVFGFTVYESFESQRWRKPAWCRCRARRAGARRPRGAGGRLRRRAQRFIVRNSWGGWGARLLLHAVRVPDRRAAGQRLLDAATDRIDRIEGLARPCGAQPGREARTDARARRWCPSRDDRRARSLQPRLDRLEVSTRAPPPPCTDAPASNESPHRLQAGSPAEITRHRKPVVGCSARLTSNPRPGSDRPRCPLCCSSNCI